VSWQEQDPGTAIKLPFRRPLATRSVPTVWLDIL